MISHDRAAAIVIAMFENGVEGAETLLQYIDGQSSYAELTDRELALRALRRAEEAVIVAQDARAAHNALVADNRTIWRRMETFDHHRLNT